MTDLASIIGPDLANDLYYAQTIDVEAAILENEPGVRRIAIAVQNDPSLASPTAVFLSRLKRGQHRQPSRTTQRHAANDLSVLERAEASYHRKLAHLNEHGALNNGWTQEDAIAYAIDYTKGANQDTETALRERVGLPPYVTAPAPESWKPA